MKSLLYAIFTAALLCGIALAQDTTPPPSASPQQSPTTQAPSDEQAAKPSAPDSQQTSQPTAPPSSTAQPQNPSRQAPSEEQSGQPNASGRQTDSGRAENNAPEATGIKRLAPGSILPVQLTKSIDAKKLKTGDEVLAKVTQDMKNNSGEVIVPKDTKVLGHVTEAQPRSKEQKESQVGIAFDRAVMANGGEMQMPMSIQAIIGPQNNNPAAGAGQPPDESPAGKTAGSNSGQAPGMRGSTPPQNSPSAGGGYPSETQTGNGARPPITAQTQGVIGIKDLKLENAGEGPSKGTVVTSEKNNVKLDSGTMLLLRVNQ